MPATKGVCKMGTKEVSAQATTMAEFFMERAKEGHIIRMWTSQSPEDFVRDKVVNVFIVKTFTSAENGGPAIQQGFQPFEEDMVFVCEAKFVHGSTFNISAVAHLLTQKDIDEFYARVTDRDCEEICKMPHALRSTTSRFMFFNEHGIPCKKDCLTSTMALALVEQRLIDLPLEKGSHFAYALWMTLEILNKLNVTNWQTTRPIVEE